jgi:hypothetical protein
MKIYADKNDIIKQFEKYKVTRDNSSTNIANTIDHEILKAYAAGFDAGVATVTEYVTQSVKSSDSFSTSEPKSLLFP